MYWIEELRNEMGDEVTLVSQKGHEHWGFVEGTTYRIVKTDRPIRTFGFVGVGAYGKELCCPNSNYAWTFSPSHHISLENK